MVESDQHLFVADLERIGDPTPHHLDGVVAALRQTLTRARACRLQPRLVAPQSLQRALTPVRGDLQLDVYPRLGDVPHAARRRPVR